MWKLWKLLQKAPDNTYLRFVDEFCMMGAFMELIQLRAGKIRIMY